MTDSPDRFLRTAREGCEHCDGTGIQQDGWTIGKEWFVADEHQRTAALLRTESAETKAVLFRVLARLGIGTPDGEDVFSDGVLELEAEIVHQRELVKKAIATTRTRALKEVEEHLAVASSRAAFRLWLKAALTASSGKE